MDAHGGWLANPAYLVRWAVAPGPTLHSLPVFRFKEDGCGTGQAGLPVVPKESPQVDARDGHLGDLPEAKAERK